MGGKRIWQGEHLLFYLACLLIGITVFIGCATTAPTPTPTIDTKSEAQAYLNKAEALARGGNYGDALNEDEKALKLFPQGFPGDHALWHMGLIWAHPGNSQRDYSKAVSCFNRIIQEFPQSMLRDEATILTSLFSELVGKESEIRNLAAKGKKSERTVYSLKYDLQKVKNQIAALKEELRKVQEEDAILKEQLKGLRR